MTKTPDAPRTVPVDPQAEHAETDLIPSWGPMRSFGRIKSRTLKPRQAGLFETLLPKIQVPDQGALSGPILKPDARELWLEIGFGGGEHLAGQAARYPDVVFLGCEPFLNGVGSALRHIDEAGLANVYVHPGDARPVIDRLEPASVSRVFILFPDPWPKSRHNKRRLIQPDLIAALARVMVPGGQLRFATDWADYADWTLRRFMASPDFEWSAEAYTDWLSPPADHLTTRYEEKKLGDCIPIFLDFVRKG